MPRATRARPAGLVLAGAIAGVGALPARAALGGDAASIEQDRARLEARHVVAPLSMPVAQAQAATPLRAAGSAATPPRVEAHRLVRPDGSTVTEFATPGGRVFAIAWSTRLKPRLDALLGAHAAGYAAAAQRERHVPGARHALSIEDADLVVQATSRLDAHAGIAYVPSLVPAGVSLDALR